MTKPFAEVGDEVLFICKNKSYPVYYGTECRGRVEDILSNICMVLPYYSGHEELYYESDLRVVVNNA